MEHVKQELSGSMLQLAPVDMPPNERILFLSVGGDIGSRTIVFESSSDTRYEKVLQ